MDQAGWRFWAALGLSSFAFSACKPATAIGNLVGRYKIHAVLVEDSCGQAALPSPSPIDFEVEIRDDDGVAYWIPFKQTRNVGTLNANGAFRFSATQTKVLQAPMRQLNPGDFVSQQTDFDLKKATCALTVTQTISGTLTRRASTSAMVGVVSGDAGATSDLSGDNVTTITPTAGSDCSAALAALGGTYTALPCVAHYIAHGVLQPTTGEPVVAPALAGAPAR